MKTLLILCLLASGCGRDESAATAPEPSPTANPAAIKIPQETEHNAGAPAETKAQAPSQATATASAAPTATPNPYQSLALIVQQPFETSKWKFDLTSPNFTYENGRADQYKFMKTPLLIYKKSIDQWGVTTLTTCLFRVTVSFPDNPTVNSWGTLMLEAGAPVGITTNQPAACQASQLQYIYFKITSQCQGYSQDTYKCGQNNINYDLVEQF